MDDGILFDISNLRHLPNTSDDGVGETTRVTLEMADTNGSVGEERVFFVSGLKEVKWLSMAEERRSPVFQHDDE